MAQGAGGKAQVPNSPDYMGIANQMGQQSMANTQYQTYANRPDIYTPEGSVTWTPPEYAGGAQAGGVGDPNLLKSTGTLTSIQSGSGERIPWFSDISGEPAAGASGATPTGVEPGRWAMNVNLSPERQAAFDAQNRLGAARSSLAETMFGRAQTELGTAPDWAGLPGAPNAQTARQQAIDANYQQATSRLDPQWAQREEAARTQLLNEGLRPGMQGYDQRMQELSRGRTDAYDTAMRSSILAGEPVAAGEFSRGLQGRQQGIAELLQRRGASLNEINALLGGQQVNMPQAPAFSQSGLPQTPDYLGAAGQTYGAGLDRYNAQQAQLQSLMQGGGGLASLFML